MKPPRWARDDRGVTLPELLVAMLIMSVLAATVISLVIWANRTTTSQTRNGDLWADLQDASTQLLRDVNDAQEIIVAEPNQLGVYVIRDDKCQQRTWVADTVNQRLTVTTTFFEQRACGGPSTTREDRIVGDNARGTNTSGTRPTLYTAPSTFTYHDTLSDTPLPIPVEPDRVTRVQWSLAARADTNMREETLKSGAAFTGRGAQTAGDGDQADPTAPLLCVSLRAPVDAACGTVPAAATGKVEGVDKPVLQWVDTSPTLTLGWTVWRIANPDGMADDDPARTSWEAIFYTAVPTQSSWVDLSLPAGYTAQYVVRATTADGVGPTSNQVATGLRPAATTVTATGALTSVNLTWTPSAGSTGYDVFRDGKLIVNLGPVTSFTDQSGVHGWAGQGYGHSHRYRVVPVNRWESVLTTGSITGRIALDADVAATYTGGVRLVSAETTASQAFTAPAAPTLASTPNTDWSNTLTPTVAGWTGSGPTSKASVARDRGWQAQYQPWGGSFSDLWVGATEVAGTGAKAHTGRAGGSISTYRARTCNAVGCSPWSTTASATQRPPTPSCSAAAASTQSVVVNLGLPAMDSAYTSWSVGGGTGAPSASGGFPSASFTVSNLRDNTAHGFQVNSSNATGTSDLGYCNASTPDLEAPTPVAPTCSAGAAGYAPTSITVTASGGSGNRQVRQSGGSWTGSNPVTYTGYSAGSHGFETRAYTYVSDGYNSDTNYSGTSSCAASVQDPPTPGAIPAGSPCTAGAQWAMGDAGSGGSGFAGIAGLRTCFYAALNATSYTADWTWRDKNGVERVGGSRGVSAGSWQSITSCFYPAGTSAYGPTVTITPKNAYGDGTPRGFVASTGAPAQSCV